MQDLETSKNEKETQKERKKERKQDVEILYQAQVAIQRGNY
jgi:hypothetical protein